MSVWPETQFLLLPFCYFGSSFSFVLPSLWKEVWCYSLLQQWCDVKPPIIKKSSFKWWQGKGDEWQYRFFGCCHFCDQKCQIESRMHVFEKPSFQNRFFFPMHPIREPNTCLSACIKVCIVLLLRLRSCCWRPNWESKWIELREQLKRKDNWNTSVGMNWILRIQFLY